MQSTALTFCKYMVSGSISLPLRGSFNLSLTVLVHYRWEVVFSLGVWSPQIPTRFHVSRGTREHQLFATKISDTRLSRSMVVLSRFVLLSFRKNYLGPTTPLQSSGTLTYADLTLTNAELIFPRQSAFSASFRAPMLRIGLGFSLFARHY